MAFKTFANGFPLPASDLNNFLMKQSVIVFADEAARTAALSEPTEGMVTYLESDDELYKWTGAAWVNVAPTPDLTSLIPKSTVTTAGDLIIADGASSVTRLGIGAADTVLTSNGTTATWEAAGGGGDEVWVLLHSGLIGTGASTWTLSGLASYDKYFVQIQDLSSAGSGSGFDLELSNSDTGNGTFIQDLPTYGNNLQHEIRAQNTGSRYMNLGEYYNNANYQVWSSLKFTGGKSGSIVTASWLGGSNGLAGGFNYWGNQIINMSGVITGLTIRSGNGAIDAGTIRVWGA